MQASAKPPRHLTARLHADHAPVAPFQQRTVIPTPARAVVRRTSRSRSDGSLGQHPSTRHGDYPRCTTSCRRVKTATSAASLLVLRALRRTELAALAVSVYDNAALHHTGGGRPTTEWQLAPPKQRAENLREVRHGRIFNAGQKTADPLEKASSVCKRLCGQYRCGLMRIPISPPCRQPAHPGPVSGRCTELFSRFGIRTMLSAGKSSWTRNEFDKSTKTQWVPSCWCPVEDAAHLRCGHCVGDARMARTHRQNMPKYLKPLERSHAASDSGLQKAPTTTAYADISDE
jgi:hypothetical protein